MLRIYLFFILILVSFSAAAHHAATGRYAPDGFGEIEGEITDIFWRNPHVRFLINRTLGDGQVEEWEVEFGSVNTVERIGVSRDMVSVGDRVSVYGRMGRDGLTAMFANLIIMPDGRELTLQAGVEQRYGLTENAFREARNTDASLRADIFRVWLPLERPNTGAGNTEYPLTEAGRAALAAWNPEDDPALRCIPPGIPTAMDNPYPIEFAELGNVIELRLEEWDGVRTIYMEGRGDPLQPRMGRSVGRWEGRTLIVESSDMDWRYVDDLGTPQSQDAVIEERFTLSEDGVRVDWVARITDPVNFTEPVVMEGVWTWVPGHEVKPFNCSLPEPAN